MTTETVITESKEDQGVTQRGNKTTTTSSPKTNATSPKTISTTTHYVPRTVKHKGWYITIPVRLIGSELSIYVSVVHTDGSFWDFRKQIK